MKIIIKEISEEDFSESCYKNHLFDNSIFVLLENGKTISRSVYQNPSPVPGEQTETPNWLIGPCVSLQMMQSFVLVRYSIIISKNHISLSDDTLRFIEFKRSEIEDENIMNLTDCFKFIVKWIVNDIKNKA